MNTTIPAAFAAAVRRSPTTPLLTWYDDRSGDRTELSGATLDNWVSKTANLLLDGAGLGEGDGVAVLLPPHWQTAAVLLGTWAAGLSADLGEPQPVEALFTSADGVQAATVWRTTDRYVTGLLPLAMPLREVPAGYVDYVVDVRNFGDHFRPGSPVLADDRAMAGPVELTHEMACEAAMERAAELGITAGDRVLFDTAGYPDPVDWLLAPLLAGASIVLCAGLDSEKLSARVDAEKVSVQLL
jgi:uncharacterized protein (TIGR03089 family)